MENDFLQVKSDRHLSPGGLFKTLAFKAQLSFLS